jgi:integrase
LLTLLTVPKKPNVRLGAKPRKELENRSMAQSQIAVPISPSMENSGDIEGLMPLQEAIGIWVESRRPFIAPRTYFDYKDVSRKPLVKFFGTTALNEITAGKIRQYQMWRLQICGGQSINHECSLLQQMLKRVGLWARIADHYQPIPLPKVGPGIALNEQQEAAWFAAAAIKQEWRVAYLASLLSVNTSAGPGEILNLRLENIRLNEIPPEIQIIQGTKNRFRIRHIPLNDKAKWAVEQLVARAKSLGAGLPTHYLVPYRVKRNDYDPCRRAKSWQAAHIEICAAAGIKIRIYDFRHTAITRMLEAGIPEETIRAVCGHVSEQMIRRYSHIRMKSKLTAVQAILGKAQGTAGKLEKKKYLRIMVNCSVSGTLVYTGMATEEQAFRSDANCYSSSFVCSECGQTHPWEKRDAFLLP